MYGLNEYAIAFKNGLNYVLYGSDEETRKEPTLDKSDIESIGYYDGYHYGIYLEITGQAIGSDDQLIGEIDKWHNSALNRYSKELKLDRKEKDSVK